MWGGGYTFTGGANLSKCGGRLGVGGTGGAGGVKGNFSWESTGP